MENLDTRVEINPRIRLPLLKNAVLSIENFIPENDTLFEEDAQGRLTIIQSDTIFKEDFSEQFSQFNADEIDPFSFDTTLTFEMEDTTFNNRVGLNEMKGNLAPAIQSALETQNGNNVFPGVPLPPSTDPVDAGKYPVGNIKDFNSITFSDGQMQMHITNELNQTIDTINIKLIGYDDNGTEVNNYEFEFKNIAPGERQSSDEVDLSDKTLADSLVFHIAAIYIPASNNTPQPLDLDNDAIVHELEIKNVEIQSAETMVDGIETETFSDNITIMDEPIEDMTIEKIYLNSGGINYSIDNALPERIEVYLAFPNTTIDGSTLEETIVVEGNESKTGTIDMAGSITTLDPTNYYLPYEYYIKMDSSTDPATVIPNQTFSVSFEIQNIDDFTLAGYFGQRKIDLEEQQLDLGSMGDMGGFLGKGNSMELADPKITIGYLNSIGMETEIDFNLKSPGDSLTIDEPFIIQAPADRFADPYEGEFTISNNNSNISKFLAIPLPESIIFSGKGTGNPDADPANTENFLNSTQSELKAWYNIEIPLAIRTEGISLQDTFPAFEGLPEGLLFEELQLILSMENDFPFNISVKLTPWDSAGNELFDPMLDTLLMKAAPVDDNGITRLDEVEPFETSLKIDKKSFENLQLADHLIANITLDTKDPDNPDKIKDAAILTSYKIKLALSIQGKAKFTEVPSFGDEDDDGDEDGQGNVQKPLLKNKSRIKK